MKYYRLTDDMGYPNRWHLGQIGSVDNWRLVHSMPHFSQPLGIEVFRIGAEMDFTLTETYGIPVVSSRIKEALGDLEDVSFLELDVLEGNTQGSYFAMVTLKRIDCVDERRSEFQKFEENDPVRPDKAGHYRGFMKLRIIAKRAGSSDIFRLNRFETAIIVSEKVKDLLDNLDATGTAFELVA